MQSRLTGPWTCCKFACDLWSSVADLFSHLVSSKIVFTVVTELDNAWVITVASLWLPIDSLVSNPQATFTTLSSDLRI